MRRVYEFFATRALCLVMGVLIIFGGIISPAWVLGQIISAMEENGWHHPYRMYKEGK